MTVEASELWSRALRSLKTATLLVREDPDTAASRAYYAAFYGVAALFSLEDRTFAKHTALEAAVHRDLVKTGRCSKEFGAAFSWLAGIRITGDYGGDAHATLADAQEAVRKAESILQSLRKIAPDLKP